MSDLFNPTQETVENNKVFFDILNMAVKGKYDDVTTYCESNMEDINSVMMLAILADMKEDYENMKKYYNMAIEKGNKIFPVQRLANYYSTIEFNEERKQYYLQMM